MWAGPSPLSCPTPRACSRLEVSKGPWERYLRTAGSSSWGARAGEGWGACATHTRTNTHTQTRTHAQGIRAPQYRYTRVFPRRNSLL
eukprot:1178948-Prorocentrum_minimum.AAC.7